MPQNEHGSVVELHARSAYAHMAAAHGHGDGDQGSDQQLAKKGLVDSVKAVKDWEGNARDPWRSLEV